MEKKLYEVQYFKERHPFPDDSGSVRFKTKEEAVIVRDKYRKDGYMTCLVAVFYDEDAEDYFED
jgi:hypothetical protein